MVLPFHSLSATADPVSSHLRALVATRERERCRIIVCILYIHNIYIYMYVCMYVCIWHVCLISMCKISASLSLCVYMCIYIYRHLMHKFYKVQNYITFSLYVIWITSCRDTNGIHRSRLAAILLKSPSSRCFRQVEISRWFFDHIYMNLDTQQSEFQAVLYIYIYIDR